MAEMWDIARYVENHPHDFEQRWRLAKKLYMAWEYRLALENLQVLRNEWEPRANVARYLAATYYRLGRYAEAVDELERSIRQWPDEIGLHEQLARVMEVSGDREGSANIWEKVLELDPNHPIAAKSAKRLRQTARESANDDLHLADSDDGIDLNPGQVCANCGAHNSDEFDRCWQCHEVLPVGGGAPAAPAEPTAPPEPVLAPEVVGLAGGLITVALLAFDLYLTLTAAFPGSEANETVISTLSAIYEGHMLKTRLITGLVMLAAWPAALWILMFQVGVPRDLPNGWINVTGLLLAAVAYACSWLPGASLWLVLIVPAILAFAIVAGLFKLSFSRALIAWAGHLLIVLVVGVLTLVVCEITQTGQFFNPFTEIPAILRYAADERSAVTPGAHQLPGAYEEDALGERWASDPLRWESSDSEWIDLRAGQTQFTVTLADTTGKLYFEIADSTGTKIYEPLTQPRTVFDYPVAAGEVYHIKVVGEAARAASITASGLLRPGW